MTTPFDAVRHHLLPGTEISISDPRGFVLLNETLLFVLKSKHGAERIITINISPVMFGARLRVVSRRGEFPARPRKSYTGVLSYSEVGSPPSTRLVTPRSSHQARGPRHASAGRYFLSTLGGWSMSNSSVASLPAKSMMAFLPPGWSGKNFETS